MDTISDYLAFSQILESGPINASLYITGLSLSNNNISFTYHECLYEFCLTCAVQLLTYLRIQQSWQVALSSHSLFCKKLFSSKHIVLNSKQFCFCAVIEEYQTFWNNLHKAALIWFGFLSISNICLLYPNFKKRQYGFNIPISYLIWCHFNRFDGALFSVKAVVTNA